MATYTNLNIPRLGNAALQAFVKMLAPLSVFSTNFSADVVDSVTRGNVILVPLVGTLTATTFGGSYAICGGTKTVVTVNLTRHKLVPIGQQDLDALNNSDSALESFGYEQGNALAQAVLEDVLTLVTTAAAGYASAGQTTAANMDLTQLRAARLALNQGNAPKTSRVALIDSVGMDALLAVTNFIQAQMFADNTVLREGRVTRALGFDFYELNSSFPSANSVNAFFAHPQAIAIAMRYVAPQRPDKYDNATQFADPLTGATFGLRDYYDPLTGTRYLNLECNYGYSVGITNGGRIIKRLD
jgi:hypothetical protein